MAIDTIVLGGLNRTSLFWLVVILLALPLVTRYLLSFAYNYIITKEAQKLAFQLRCRYLDHLFEMDSKFYESYPKGDLISRVTNDLDAITTAATSMLEGLIFNTSVIVLAIAMMGFTISWKLTADRGHDHADRAHRTQRDPQPQAPVCEETSRNLCGIHRQDPRVGRRHEGHSRLRAGGERPQAPVRGDRQGHRVVAVHRPLRELVQPALRNRLRHRVLPGVRLWRFLRHATRKSPSASSSPSSPTSARCTGRSSRSPDSSRSSTTPRSRSTGSKRSWPPPRKSRTNQLPGRSSSFNRIDFKNVTFKYPFDKAPVIKNIDFSIEKGQTIGIVGPTGAGKSTLIRQLLREFNVTDGVIAIDGVPIGKYKIHDVRRLVGYVPQAHMLFKKARRREHHDRQSARPPRRPRQGGQERRLRKGRHVSHRRLAHAGRRSGRDPVRRTEAAPFDRPRADQGPGDPDPRRLALGGRREDRGEHHRTPPRNPRRKDQHHHLAPLLRDPRRGPDPRPRGGEDHPAREARGSAQAGRLVQRPVHPADHDEVTR
ncbi:MAG: ABC transporter ATP-binding protein/permease [Desulfomicrobium escambiense]|nr:ABC transporter ATP-binding protein/permease [Desulfomicrobium escambiense]